MLRIISFRARVFAPELLYWFRMAKTGEQVYYAVGRGRETGIYNTWSECKARIDGISNAKYRKFFSLAEAEEFVQFWKDYSSPSKNLKDDNCVSSFSESESALDKAECNKNSGRRIQFQALGVENFMKRTNHVALQPYISPIPLSLQSQFRQDYRNVDNFKNVGMPMRRTLVRRERQENAVVPSRTHSLGTSSFALEPPKNFITLSSSPPPPVKSALINEASSQGNATYSQAQAVSQSAIDSQVQTESQSAHMPSNSVIKQEKVQEDEELSDVCSKLPECLRTVELALKGAGKESCSQSKEIRDILKQFLERIVETNCHNNPQMVSGESDNVLDESNDVSKPEVRAEEPTSSQQQNSEPATLLSPPCLNASTSPAQKSLDQKGAEVLALNLRLDSFEKRFDVCLKEVGAIMSEISHIKTEIKDIKETLGQSASSCSSRRGKDGMLQTTLTFASPTESDSGRLDNSSRAYSTGRGRSNWEGESGEYKSNRGKRRRLSRSNSLESSSRKCLAEENDDDILNRIKIEEVAYTSFCLDENDFVEVYTDGACHYNGERKAKAGIGIWFGDSHPLNVSEPVMGLPTNNVAEIQAARIAIELAIKAGVKKLKVLTDSEFLINCVTKWIQRWKRNGWTLIRGGAVKNQKELEKLDKAASKINVRWEKVLAHSGIKGNEMADRLANQGAEKYVR